MRLPITKLKFTLPDNPFGACRGKLTELSHDLKKLSSGAGTENLKFQSAYSEIYTAAIQGGDINSSIKSKTHVRAFAIALKTAEIANNISISRGVLERVQLYTPKPTSLFVESLFDYFLGKFKAIKDISFVSQWLLSAKKVRGQLSSVDHFILSPSGPKWLADKAIEYRVDFDAYVGQLKLDRYASGDFMTAAKRIYYVEKLKTIAVNQPHEILSEIQRKSVFESRYDEHALLGHKALETLIERAPHGNISDAWLNVILAIGGDPRIPSHHPKYIKWWSHIPSALINKVRGWLSKLDLRLFLEALEAYSESSGKADLKRMYPSRKRFLEGLFDAGLISHTRLYLSYDAARYLKTHYKKEHLPSYSNVDGDKSIIYVQLGDRHLVEGSHSCYLWVYRSLSSTAIVFNYDKQNVSYYDLTSGMGARMTQEGHAPVDNIQHNPTNFSWQRKAISQLKAINVPITMKQVLTEADYNAFVRRFGVDV